jgi:PPOX class probable F420-dependent enzyme
VAAVPKTDVPPGWWQRFVTATPARTAKLAVTRADGSPHVVPVWVDLDGEGEDAVIVFTCGQDTVKGRAIRRDPRVALCWDDERPPFSYVTVRGRVTVTDDLAEVAEWAARIGGRYMGQNRAEEFGRRNGVPGELLMRVRPERVIVEINVAG